ncbi:hypothetical protein V8C86DRAFT_2507052 [Haematococcus lacustris]
MRLTALFDCFPPACFFLISVAYKLAWTAISSLLSQFSRDYGPQVLLQLNVAYFLPSIPVLLLQTLLNDRMDRRLGSRVRGAMLRFVAGLGSLIALTAHFPSIASSHTRLLGATAAVGMAYGLAFGTSYQLASRFPPSSTVMLTTGFVSSGPLVLALDLALKQGPFYSPAALSALFTWVSRLTGAGLAAACLLLLACYRTVNAGQLGPSKGAMVSLTAQPLSGKRAGQDGQLARRGTGPSRLHQNNGLMGSSKGPPLPLASNSRPGSTGSLHPGQPGHSSMTMSGQGSLGPGPGPGGLPQSVRRTSSGGGADTQQHHAVMLDVMEGGRQAWYEPADQWSQGIQYEASTGKAAKPDMPLLTLAWRISPAMLAIFLSVGTSMLVFPFFTFVRSTGLLSDRLAQVLFYIRLLGDVVGRLAPRRLQASSRRALIGWAAVKTAMVPLVFAAIFIPEAVGGDLGICLYVALFWVLSGYLNTCAYLVAPSLVPPHSKARASGLMTVAFQTSCLVALLAAAAVQAATATASSLSAAHHT